MKGLSIIITYYKGEKFIFNCIDSIVASYEASLKKMPFEITLIIDSIDDADHISEALSAKYGAQWLHIVKNAVNIGVSKSRNVGLKLINYQFYTIIDQDDYVKKDYFKALEQELDDTIALHIINGTILSVKNNLEIPIYYFTPVFEYKALILKDTIIYTPGLLVFNTQYLAAEGLFIDASDKYKGCDDWAAYLNMLTDKKHITQKFIKQPLFVYCLHDENFSNNKEEMINSSIAVLDFLKTKKNMDASIINNIAKADAMQKFYYAKDVYAYPKSKLLFNFPMAFLSHYVFSFFNKARLNRLIFRIREKVKWANV